MRHVVTTLPECAVTFESAGHFIGTPGWIHQKRTLPSFELIVVTRGTLPLRVDDRDLRIGMNDVLLIPPNCTHEGSAYLKQPLEFSWAHFLLPTWRHVTDAKHTPRSRPRQQTANGPGHVNLTLPVFSTGVDTSRLTVMFDQLLDIYEMTFPEPSLYCDCFTASMLCEAASLNHAAPAEDSTSRRRHSLQNVREWIRINALDDLSVNGIAERFHYSPSYLSTLYRQHYGVSITEQIIRVRIEHAQKMLLQTSMSIRQVAEESGYRDAKYFMRVFKQSTGLTPTRYRTSFSRRHFNTH